MSILEYVDNYERSNNITKIPNLKISAGTKTLYRKYRELSVITQKQLQSLSDALFVDLGLKTVNISFSGRRPYKHDGKRLKKETLGVHYKSFLHQSIQVYKYTAVKQDIVKPKTAISILLHEICHNLDYNILNLTKSIHSKGFYLRLKYLMETIA